MGTAIVKDGRILLPAEWVGKPDVKARLRTSWSKRHRCWFTYATPDNVAAVNREFGLQLRVPVPERAKIVFPFKTKPRDYQLEALSMGLGKPAFAYLLDPGLGKSKVTVDEAQILASQGRLDTVLVVCPFNAKATWVTQITTHGWWERWSVRVWGRPDLSVDPTKAGVPQLRWAVINKDALVSPTKKGAGRRRSDGYAWVEKFLTAGGATMIVVDESTDIAGHDSFRTDAVFSLRKFSNYRRELNGTFIADKPLDCYSQLYWLDPAIVYDWSYFGFRSHFCHMGGFEVRGKPVQVVGYKNLDELHTMIKSVSYMAKQEEVEDLPERVYQTREIALSEKTRKAYNSVVLNFETELDAGTITIEQVITRSVKLRQITGGAVRDDIGWVRRLGTEKIDDFMAYVRQIGDKKFLVWCEFTHEVEALTQALSDAGVASGRYDGNTNGRDRDFMERAFEHGDLQALVIQNQTGYRALTLNAAHYVFVFSNPEKLDVRVQLEKRSHRIGQTKSVVYVDFVVPGSIDEVVRGSQAFKKDVADFVMSGEGDGGAERSVRKRLLRTI